MRESTNKKLVDVAKTALIGSGLQEITTKRQAKNGTTSWLCDETGYEYAEYPSGYVRRVNVLPYYHHFYKKISPNMYPINPRFKKVEVFPEEWIHYKGKLRRVKELKVETFEYELIHEQHSRLLYILAFSQGRKLKLQKMLDGLLDDN